MSEEIPSWVVQAEVTDAPVMYAFDRSGRDALIGLNRGTAVLDLRTGAVRMLETSASVESVARTEDGSLGVASSETGIVTVWDLARGQERCAFDAAAPVEGVAISRDGRLVAAGTVDAEVWVWDIETGESRLQVRRLDAAAVKHLNFDRDNRRLVSAHGNGTSLLWDIAEGECIDEFSGHAGTVWFVEWSPDQRTIASGGTGGVVRIWDAQDGRAKRALEGHHDTVLSLAWREDGRFLLTGSNDRSARVWDVERGVCVAILNGHDAQIQSVGWIGPSKAVSGDHAGTVRIWDLSGALGDDQGSFEDQTQYTNAKVLLVGDSHAGKTGLSKRLASNVWEISDSTVGAWSTQWKLQVESEDGLQREIWLWDFGGQADQRLIHQLYMDDAALAVLVFDGQRENVIESLEQWDRDLTRAGRRDLSKLLVLGRADAGGLRMGQAAIDEFCDARGYAQYIETSAKTGEGCDDLRGAILDGIDWDRIPWRSTPVLFKRLREEVIRLKDEGRALLRMDDLHAILRGRVAESFDEDELRAVILLLSGPGVVWKLAFGDLVLLRPELINAYAQGVIQTLRKDELERGMLPEQRILDGDLEFGAMERLPEEDERLVLQALDETLLKRSLCVRSHTEDGALLLFPSFYRRERPELTDERSVLVSYTFSGYLDEIYATLVVRLDHTQPFEHDALWRYAADFKTLTGKRLGLKLTARSDGVGELAVYFDQEIPIQERIIFSKYVHEHLLANARDVVRLRHYICPHCGTSVGNREVALRRLQAGKEDIVCVGCEDRVPLWDELEELFASEEVRKQVRELKRQTEVVLDNESRERVLVGEAIATIGNAGQISRELTVSDHGIDMELEFKDSAGEATGNKLYLQLKSGDSYLRERKTDGKEIFQIKNERHVRYWAQQAFPVMLVVRNSDGEVRWMEVGEQLKANPTRQLVFEGEPFTVQSVLEWRDRVL